MVHSPKKRGAIDATDDDDEFMLLSSGSGSSRLDFARGAMESRQPASSQVKLNKEE